MASRSPSLSLSRLAGTRAGLAIAILAVTSATAAKGLGLGWPIALIIAAGGAALALSISRRTGPGPRDAAVPEEPGNANDMSFLIAVLDLPALVIDQDSRVLTHNPRARELFPNIADGQPWFHVSRNPELLEAVQRAVARGEAQSVIMAERTLLGRRLLVSIKPLHTAETRSRKPGSARTPVTLIQFRDLSEQDRLTQLRSDFIANASHELRTPLASIKGFIETLQGPASGDAAARKRFLAIMEAQASRMARILDDLLSLSRIEMRAHVPPNDDVDVRAVARAAVQGLEPIAREAKIRLHLDTPPEPCWVRGDKDQIEQVLQNLIENAIKYGKPDGQATVTVTRQMPAHPLRDRVVLTVADDGPGIAEEHLPRLTERFYRPDTAASRERGGTGLGLAIVKHIVNRHRGELKITSTLGVGSAFTVLLDAVSPLESHPQSATGDTANEGYKNLLNDLKD